MTYRAWLKKQIKRQDPVGDFSRDWFVPGDRTKARKFKSILKYLEGMNACEGAKEAFMKSWNEWKGDLP